MAAKKTQAAPVVICAAYTRCGAGFPRMLCRCGAPRVASVNERLQTADRIR
jgi:hypothetical protein